MTRYIISYEHTAGPNSFYVDSEEEKDKALERIGEDPHVIQSTVKVETKEFTF